MGSDGGRHPAWLERNPQMLPLAPKVIQSVTSSLSAVVDPPFTGPWVGLVIDVFLAYTVHMNITFDPRKNAAGWSPSPGRRESPSSWTTS